MGGGGASYFPESKPDLEKLVQQSKKDADAKRLDSDVNQALREILASYVRDPERVQDYLEKIGEILGDEADLEQFLFGGSVAKHTYVDGLSDIDALVILKREDIGDTSPQDILDQFEKALQDKLTFDVVEKVERGRMAVTVTYRDQTEIQLLPAVRVGTKVLIPNAGAEGWKETRPKIFQRALSNANQRLNEYLVPTIKLVKSIVSGFPEHKQLPGYHVESLALEVVKGYRQAKTPKALLMHIVEQAASRVLRPVNDMTGQSRIVDSYLGNANSTERKAVSQTLAGVSRRLKAATTVDQWKAILEP